MLLLRRGVGSADRAAPSVVPAGAAIARLLHSAVQSATSRPAISKDAPHRTSLNIKVQQRVEASRLKQANVRTAAPFLCAWVGTGHAVVVRRARHMHSSRAMSSGAEDTQKKVRHEGEPMFLSLPGSADAHTVKVNKEKRLIVGLENTMKLLSNEIGKEVPGVVSTLNDNGLPEIRWSPAQTQGVLAYLKAHEFTAIEASYKYEGAFASGVKKVKVLSLFSLVFTSVGGPLLVIGDGAATAMQWAMAGAVVFFGVSTTGLLHMITSPYVLSLRRLADGSFEAVKPVITGGESISRFRAQDVRPSSMPFETFKAQVPGGALQGYYIHKELFLGDEGQEMLCALLGVDAAEEMYEKQLAENPGDLDTLYNYGRFLWKVQKDLPAAEGAFVRVLEEDPNDDDAKQALVELGREMAAVGKSQ